MENFEGGKIQVSFTVKELIEVLQCQNCKKFPNTEKSCLARCKNSRHFLCENCQWCPECSGDGKNQSVPMNLFNEVLVQKLPWICSNFKNGCQVLFSKDETDEAKIHEKECIFRQVPCPCCKSPVVLKDASDHLLLSHPKAEIFMDEGKKGYLFKFSKDKDYEMIAIPIGKDMIFSCNVFNQEYYFWVQFLGTQEEAHHHVFQFILEKGLAKIQFQNLCHSVDESVETIIKNKQALVISKENMKNFHDEKGCFDVRLSTRSLKEEIKDEDIESGISE